MDEQLYDVIVYHLETKKIEGITGTNLRLDNGYHNAEKRLETTEARLNDSYTAEIVPAGKYKKGDTFKK